MGLGLAVVLACGHEEVRVTFVPESCPEAPEPEQVRVYEECYESLACKKAQHVMHIRNTRLDERMDECEARGNSYVDCMHWIFGYLPEGVEDVP